MGSKEAESRSPVKYWKTALAILTLSASVALAEDFKTVNGKEYKNATVTRVEPDGILLKTKSGISKVYFTELPKEVQERFHYDPAKAAQFNAATAQQQAPAQAPAQTPTQAPARPEENMRNIREVETDQRSFFDQTFLLKGTIEVSNYYNFGYSEAEPTHYAFRIRDDSTGHECYAYMERAKAAELHQRVLNAGGPVKGVFAVILLRSRYSHPGELDVELLDCRLEQ